MATHRLDGSQREFLSRLADVAFGNPYTPERNALIRRLAPDAPGNLASDREALARVVAPKLRSLMAGGLAAYGDDDRSLLEPALLYVTYHRFVPQIDAHIEWQDDRPGEPGRIAFGDDVMAELMATGLAEEQAALFFGFFFQLRRAYYFIGQSLAGESEPMERFRRALWNNIFTHDMRRYASSLWSRMEDFSTLLLGETGTGKGAAAAAIGRSEFIDYLPKERRFAANFAETFISINLSQFSETLIESELFGHRKGAFTSAVDHHQGVFERCSKHGALFLDEIGEASVPMQIKLLRVLQEREFTPVGGREEKRFWGRVIAATNRSLADLRQSGRFRDDFYYRLCSDIIHVPTLRERIEVSPGELAELVGLMVKRTIRTKNPELAAYVLAIFERDLPRGYAWPGNVRELEQAVRRVLLTGSYKPDLASAPSLDAEERLVARLRDGNLSAEELLSAYSALLYRRLGSYAAVAERTGLDPRTSRKYVLSAKSG
jgi:DNA-binding NtrC family response regulator